jgi:hypothetical protein
MPPLSFAQTIRFFLAAVDDGPEADGFSRVVQGLTVIPYDLPAGSAGSYFLECHALFALSHHDPRSGIPSFKSVAVRVISWIGTKAPKGNRGEAARPVGIIYC